MKFLSQTFILVLLTFWVLSCGEYVQNVDKPINNQDDSLLTSESQAVFMMNGVKAKFSSTLAQITVCADGLSDQLIFTRMVPGATYPQFEEMESGNIQINNNSVKDVEQLLGQLRFYADTLAGRANYISWTDTAKMFETYYTGYLYGGIARFMYASYFALEPENGGGVINAGPFIPSNQMYQLALARFDQALQYADPSQAKIVHSFKARVYLALGLYSEAASEAELGLTEADGLFEAQYSFEASNFWWQQAGNGRSQWAVDNRFNGYVQADPTESTRIPLIPIEGYDGAIYYLQGKYPDDKSPIVVLSWQEMQLIQAEALARSNQNTEALTFVNTVRASHGLDARTETNLDSIMIERDKELFCMGMRLIDQRRADKWHLPPGAWKFLPITEEERESNPNLK